MLLREFSKAIPPLDGEDGDGDGDDSAVIVAPASIALQANIPDEEAGAGTIPTTFSHKDSCHRPEDAQDIELPSVTFEEARKIMTRTDFIDPLDVLHVCRRIKESLPEPNDQRVELMTQIISIDTKHCVRPDSMLTLRAAQRICAQEGFDENLDTTRDRIDQIEGASSSVNHNLTTASV